jgi:hypothetical protein
MDGIRGSSTRMASDATGEVTARVSVGGTLTIDQRLDHINSALDTARSKAASVRTGQMAMPMRSAGRKDRVWIEQMDGFLTQVLIDDAYFATAPIVGIASEVTRCLADLGDVSATPPRLTYCARLPPMAKFAHARARACSLKYATHIASTKRTPAPPWVGSGNQTVTSGGGAA